MNLERKRTWAEVDLGSIRHNIRNIASALPTGTKVLGVVKANAYGHGALPVAEAMLQAGAGYLAVACLAEAVELREAGIAAPVLILGVTPPELAPELVKYGITQAVSGIDYARALSEQLDAPLKCHMKLETGMGRTGFSCREEKLVDITNTLCLPNLDFEGVFTHFCVSDCPEQDFTQTQFGLFTSTIEKAENATGKRFEIKHCANSGAVINYREMALDMVRPGVISYGMYPAEEHGGLDLRPALSLKSRVYAITEHLPGDTVSYGRTFTVTKPMRLAVIPVGYADGLSRNLSNKLEVIINGRRCRQVGRICMDMCMVDITDLNECVMGDIVTLIGTDGGETILAGDLADKIGTINYEITCDISPRVPRIYL